VIEAFALPGLEDVWQIPDVITPLHFFDDHKYPAFKIHASMFWRQITFDALTVQIVFVSFFCHCSGSSVEIENGCNVHAHEMRTYVAQLRFNSALLLDSL